MDGAARRQFLDDLARKLQENGAGEANLLAILDHLLGHFDCVVGTIHSFDADSGMLFLRAHRGVPDHLMDRVRAIPIGKGMAGLAAERRQPVQVCNLQTDSSGAAKPGAKETQMEGSIAVPILVADTVRGTLGIAKPVPYEFSDAESALLLQAGTAIGRFLNSAR